MSDIALMVLPVVNDYPEDTRLLMEALHERSLDMQLGELIHAYRKWSEEEYCAGWMSVSTKEFAERIIDSMIENRYIVPFDDVLESL